MKAHRRLSLSAEPTTGTMACRAGSLIQNHGEGAKILPGAAGGTERAGALPAAAEGEITVAAVQSAAERLLGQREAMKRQYRERCEQLERTIGGLLEALRHKLGAGLKNIAGDGCPAQSHLSGLLNGEHRWTPETLRAVLGRLAALEREKQQTPKTH